LPAGLVASACALRWSLKLCSSRIQITLHWQLQNGVACHSALEATAVAQNLSIIGRVGCHRKKGTSHHRLRADQPLQSSIKESPSKYPIYPSFHVPDAATLGHSFRLGLPRDIQLDRLE
ncbi:unnamed protein product, partial [Closterium sp. Yama58-4]